MKPVIANSVSSSILDGIRSIPEGVDMDLLPRPCRDCAVVCGFYKEHSDAFLEMPMEERLAKSK